MSMAGRIFMSAPVKIATGGALTAAVPHGLAVNSNRCFAICASPYLKALPAADVGMTCVDAGDATNIILTLTTDPGVDTLWIVFAFVDAEFADETAAVANTGHRNDITGASHTTLVTNATAGATHAGDAGGAGHTTLIAQGALANSALTKQAAGNTTRRSEELIVPTAYGTCHRRGRSLRSLAGGANETLTTAQLNALTGAGNTGWTLIDFTKPVKVKIDNPAIDFVCTLGAGGVLASIAITNRDAANIQNFNLIVEEPHSFER